MEKFSKYRAYRGNIIYSQDKDTLICKENSYILVLDGIVKGIYKHLPLENPKYV